MTPNPTEALLFRLLMRQPRPERREPQAGECVWVVSAFEGRACGQKIPEGMTGYCPEHRRVFKELNGS